MRYGYLILLLAVSAHAANLLNGQPGVAVPANTWTLLTPTGYDQRIVGWEKLNYVPGYGVCMVAMYREISSERNHAWICYDPKTNRRNVLEVGSTFDTENDFEGGHAVAGIGIDPTTSTAYGACCFATAQQSMAAHGTYLFDFNGQVGRVKQTASGININNQQMGGVFDPLHHKMVIHGGTSFAGTSEYSVANNTWTNGITCTVPSSNCPDPSLLQAAMDYDSYDGKIYLFGGSAAGVVQNGVFVYDPVAQTWSSTSPSGTPPSARQMAGFVYMKASNKFLMYGGGDDCCSNIHNDTWIYDPVAVSWTQLSPAVNPTAGNSSVFERMAYIPEDDLVIMEVLDLASAPEGRTYAFRYYPGGNIGTVTPAYAATAGSLNRNTDSWVRSPSQSVSGTTVYRAWVESGAKSDSSNSEYLYPYAASSSAASITNLGSAYNSMESDLSPGESEDIGIATVAGTPWACWHQGDNSSYLDHIVAKYWNGSAWVGGAIGKATSGATAYAQGQCQIADVGGTPYIVFREFVNDTVPPIQHTYVMSWGGSAWALVGGALNRDGSGAAKTETGSVSIASNGTHPCAVWSEYTVTTAANQLNVTAPQVYTSCWSGSAWTPQGGYANVNTAHRTFAVSATYMGQLYVAFMERTDTGNEELYVRTWNGSAWSTVGSGYLNRDQTGGWAYRPELTNDGTNLYLAWEESGNDQPWAQAYSLLPAGYGTIADKAQVFAAKWNGSAWAYLGGSVNADPVNGSAQHPTLTLLSGQPALAWAEVSSGSLRGLYASGWNGTDWAPPACSVATASFPSATATESYSQTATESGCVSSTWSVASGSLPSWASLNSSTGAISGTASGIGTAKFTLSYSTATSGSLSISTNAVPSITTTILPAGTQGSAYSQALATSGGTGTIACALTTGSLSGSSLTLNSNCTITGTAATPATYTFTATPTDANGIAGSPSSSLSITINPSGGPAGGAALGGNAKTSGNAVIH